MDVGFHLLLHPRSSVNQVPHFLLRKHFFLEEQICNSAHQQTSIHNTPVSREMTTTQRYYH